MSGNTFGKLFKITTFGESHGTAMGCILDGCPPQIELTKEDIQHDLPQMKEYLSETYGITVYQEQVMLLSQKISNFSKGEADQLRKAMGKKDSKLLELLKPKFFEGGVKNKVDKIAFNYFSNAYDSLSKFGIGNNSELYSFFKFIQERHY